MGAVVLACLVQAKHPVLAMISVLITLLGEIVSEK